MYTTSDFRRGLRIQHEGQPYSITDFQHNKPGKGAATVRTKLKNLLTGQLIDPTFRSGEKFERPDLEDKECDYLYNDGETYHFMDPVSYEQFEMSKDALSDTTSYLIDNLKVDVLFHDGKPISVELPNHVVLVVTQCDPAVKGDTVQGASKPAFCETGLKVMVPLFVNEGDKLKVDTRDGHYIERA